MVVFFLPVGITVTFVPVYLFTRAVTQCNSTSCLSCMLCDEDSSVVVMSAGSVWLVGCLW